jgi:hypothetical protein
VTPALHDRLIVGEDGEVWTLGASLNSVATTSTVVVPVPQAGADALRQQAEKLWADAEQVRNAPPQLAESSSPIGNLVPPWQNGYAHLWPELRGQACW